MFHQKQRQSQQQMKSKRSITIDQLNIQPKSIQKKTVTKWHKNETFSTKKETEKVVIPSPHKKLERK